MRTIGKQPLFLAFLCFRAISIVVIVIHLFRRSYVYMYVCIISHTRLLEAIDRYQ